MESDDAKGAKSDKDEPKTTAPGEPRGDGDLEGLEEPAEEIIYVPVEESRAPGEAPPPKVAGRAHGEPEKRVRAKLKQKEAELKTVKAERDEIQDKYLRKLAEMENLRKRFDRDRQEYIQYALGDFLKELLGVLDNFERALRSRDDATNARGLQEGVEMIYRQFLDLLTKRGVRPIEIKDKTFDPAVQQAVLTEESEAVTEPQVAEELQRGYCLSDRLLRPALVKVLVPKKGEPE